MSEWISVEDRLPEENERVLIYGEDGVHVGWLCDAPNKWFAREGDWCNFAVDGLLWMPLPEGPSE